MTTDTPAAELRAAAEKLRATAGNATEGAWVIWRDLDHEGYVTVGDAAGVITPPALQSSGECNPVAHVYVEEDAEHIALMHPGVGLTLADWLESTARTVDAVAEKLQPDPAAHWIAPALAVARRILGTTEQADTEAAPTDRRERYAAVIRAESSRVDDIALADAVMAVADGEQAALRAEVEGLDEALRGAITVSEKENNRLRANRATGLREGDGLRARFEALAADWEQRGKYGDVALTWGARAIRAVLAAEPADRRLAAEAQQPTPAVVCVHPEGYEGECPCPPSCVCCQPTPAPAEETKPEAPVPPGGFTTRVCRNCSRSITWTAIGAWTHEPHSRDGGHVATPYPLPAECHTAP